MNDAMIRTDKDGKIQLMNDAAESLTGWPAEAATGRPLAEVFRIDGRAEAPHRLGRTLMTRDDRAVEIEGRAEGIRDAAGALREICVHFSRRDATPITTPRRRSFTDPPLDAA